MIYKIQIQHTELMQANNEQEAYEKFYNNIERDNETPGSFLDSLLTIKPINIDYTKATDQELARYEEIINEKMR